MEPSRLTSSSPTSKGSTSSERSSRMSWISSKTPRSTRMLVLTSRKVFCLSGHLEQAKHSWQRLLHRRPAATSTTEAGLSLKKYIEVSEHLALESCLLKRETKHLP